MADETAAGTTAEAPPCPMTPETFEVSFLYFVTPDGRQIDERSESFEEFSALWAAGWRSSLGAFGVETHPSVVQRLLNAPAPEVPTELTNTYREVLALLVAHQAQQDGVTARVETLEAQVA